MNRNLLGRARASLSIFLSALVIAWAPGLAPYQAFAGEISGAPGAANVRVSLPAVKLGDLAVLPARAPSLDANLPGLESGRISLLPRAAAPLAAPISPAQPISANAQLSSGVQQIQKAQSGGVRGVLEKLFSGSKASKSSGGEVSGNDSGSGDGFSSPEAQAYNQTRRDLALIAEKTGIVASLPAASENLKTWLLGQAAGKKVVFSDFDDTLDKLSSVASPETVAAITAVQAAGKQVVVVTDRPDTKKEGSKQVTILESLSSIPAAQRAGIIVAANKGGRILKYDASGEAQLIYEEPAIAQDEVAKIKDAAEAVKGKLAALGAAQHDGSKNIPAESLNNFGYAMMLKIGSSQDQVRAVADALQAELDARGVPYQVEPRFAKDPTLPPYVTFSKLDKSLAVKHVAQLLNVQAKDALILGDSMFTPKWSKPSWISGDVAVAAARAGIELSSPPAQLTGNSADRDMEKALPGALTLSVGATADPRMTNAWVMPGKGPEVTREILKAVASAPIKSEVLPPAPKAEEKIDKKALWGLFIQSAISIIAYSAITIAYPFAAIPVVGSHGLGVLMSFSPAMGLIAGPISGIILDRLSPRNAMAINTVARGVLLLMLPAFHYFGVLNFWTLLVAALADGFLLSSIMTVQGGSLKKIFPAKSLGPINSGMFQLYPGLQVVFGAILLIGSVIDKFNPFNVFAVASGINLLAVLPILWFTIPNIKPAAKPAQPKTAGEAKTSFLRRYWKEAVLTLAAVASFPLVHTALPASAALVYWITRTDGFKALWNGEGAEPSKEAAELAAAKTDLEGKIAAGDKSKEAELASVNAGLKREKGRMRSAMFVMALGAMMMYPLQYFGLPNMAGALAGSAHKAELFGQFLGVLFMGNLISTAAQAKMPEVKLPFLNKKVAGERLVQAVVMGLAATWVFTRLVPGSIMAAVAAVAIVKGLMTIAQKLSSRGWISLFGVGFAAIWLPFMVWSWPALLPFLTVKTAMFASLIAIGMAYGPSFVSAITYFMTNAKKDRMGEMTGINGAMLNAAISLGYGLLTLASGLAHPAFPALLAVLGVAYAAAGAIFARWPKLMPGLPKGLFLSKPKAKA